MTDPQPIPESLPGHAAPPEAVASPPLARCATCACLHKVVLVRALAGSFAEIDEALQGLEHHVEAVWTGSEALKQVRESQYEFAIWDALRPSPEDVDLLRQLRELCPRLPVVVLADDASAFWAIEYLKVGAQELLFRPFPPQQLQEAAARAIESRSRSCHAELLSDAPAGLACREFVGSSPAMQELYRQIGRVAARDESVLIVGETGTGKELVARAIHRHSRRRAQPFVALNCAALPESLLENELFGHESGAYTGATRRYLGAFEQAQGGILLLDEVGEIPPTLQTKLLRVLEQGEVRRLGGSETIRVDVRVLAATNRPLHGTASAGTFREDLYYRLNCVAIHVPPLRDHFEDLRDLVHHFIALYTPPGQVRPALDASALRKLQAYRWPGNVRELENTIRRALVLGNPAVILADDLQFAEGEAVEPPIAAAPAMVPCAASPPRGSSDQQLELALHRWLASRPDSRAESLMAQVERRLIAAALRHSGGNQTQAARLLGISRSTLRDWLKSPPDQPDS